MKLTNAEIRKQATYFFFGSTNTGIWRWQKEYYSEEEFERLFPLPVKKVKENPDKTYVS